MDAATPAFPLLGPAGEKQEMDAEKRTLGNSSNLSEAYDSVICMALNHLQHARLVLIFQLQQFELLLCRTTVFDDGPLDLPLPLVAQTAVEFPSHMVASIRIANKGLHVLGDRTVRRGGIACHKKNSEEYGSRTHDLLSSKSSARYWTNGAYPGCRQRIS